MLDVVMRGVGGLSSFPDVLGRMIEDGGVFSFLMVQVVFAERGCTQK